MTELSPSEPLKLDMDRDAVRAQRSKPIGTTLDMIRAQKNELPENPEDYVAHMRAAIRKREEDAKGRVRNYFETATDHDYLQVEAYDVLATEAWWKLRAEEALGREESEQLEHSVPFERSRLGELGYIGTVLPQPPTLEQDEDDLEFQEPYWHGPL